MASDAFSIEIDLIDKDPAQIVEALAVDRSILKDDDIAFIYDSLPAHTEARIDQQSPGSYVGIDLFYGKDGNVKGLVFVTRTRALVVRIPDTAAKNAVELYEKKLLNKPEDKPKPPPRTKYKGKQPAKFIPEKTPYERLRQLLDLNLVAFGMAQITLTLWETLRERVEGRNLSTIVSKPLDPPNRTIPDPNAPISDDEGGADESGDKVNTGGNRGNRGKGGRGGPRGRGRGGGKNKGRGKDQGRKNNDEKEDSSSILEGGPKTIPVPAHPEDAMECRDRKSLSPGYIVNKLYPHVTRISINSVFFGLDREADMFERVAEAISRAWVAHVVANHEALSLAVRDAHIIKPSRLNDEELTFFAKSMVTTWRVMGEEEADHAIEKEDMKQGDKNKIVSGSHKKRVRPSKYQEIRIKTKDDQEMVLYGKRVRGKPKEVRLAEDELTSSDEDKPKNNRQDENGAPKGKKNGHRQHIFKDLLGSDEFASNAERPTDEELTLGDQPLFDFDNIKSVQVYGREEATRSEDARDMFVLRLLEGRGSLRGEDYENCEFIRRVWFPTKAQKETGKKREEERTRKREERHAKKLEEMHEQKRAVKPRYDWVDGDWGDDTDEEEAAHALANKVSELELIDNDTEDENIGDELEREEIEELVPKLKGKINDSQLKVIQRITAPNPKGRTRATLVHGPPGTGKTSTITAAAIRLVNSGEYVWIVAQSNVGISNVADKLRRINFHNFALIVANEYYAWWEGQYEKLKKYVVRTGQLKGDLKKHFKGKKLILCTLASLSNPDVEDLVMYQYASLTNLIIDEASQIDMTSEFMHLFFKHRYFLKNICWFGDPMQLPPYGWSETTIINDIFKVEHLQANSKLMDVSYRLPIPIADFISKEVYKKDLEHDPEHEVIQPTEAMLFVDVPKGEELRETNGTSFMNLREAEVVVQIVELYYNKMDKRTNKTYEFTVITPYEAQRKLVQSKLKERGIDQEVYNVDSFQGNEADYIITTLTKTTFSSFLSSINRLNVLLTRCKRGLVVVSKKDFIIRTGGLLRGLWWAHENADIWKDAKEVSKGYVDLPGSRAPFKRPVGKSEEEGSSSEDNE